MNRPTYIACVASIALGVVLNFGTGCATETLQNRAKTAASVLDGAATALGALAEADGAGGLLDLALGYLEAGQLEQCCRAVRLYLSEHQDDKTVRALLALLETQLENK